MAANKWTEEEDRFLIENYPLLGEKCREELNQRFGKERSKSSIHIRASKLGIKISSDIRKKQNCDYLKKAHEVGPNAPWAKEEEQFLIDNYTSLGALKTAKELEMHFGNKRTPAAVRTKAQNLYRDNSVLDKLLVSKEAHFEKREVGTIITKPNGTMWIKVKKGSNSWIPLSHYIVGDVADDECVIFLDKNRQNTSPDNLVRIKKSVWTRLRTGKLYSENQEITKTGIMICELIEAMKQQEKGE